MNFFKWAVGDVAGGGAWTLPWRQDNSLARGHPSSEWGGRLTKLISIHIPSFPEHCQIFLRRTWAGAPGGECRWRFKPLPPPHYRPDQHEAEGQQQGQLPWAYRPGGRENRGGIRSREKGWVNSWKKEFSVWVALAGARPLSGWPISVSCSDSSIPRTQKVALFQLVEMVQNKWKCLRLMERTFCVPFGAQYDFVRIRSETRTGKLGRPLFAFYRTLKDTGLSERGQD